MSTSIFSSPYKVICHQQKNGNFVTLVGHDSIHRFEMSQSRFEALKDDLSSNARYQRIVHEAAGVLVVSPLSCTNILSVYYCPALWNEKGQS